MSDTSIKKKIILRGAMIVALAGMLLSYGQMEMRLSALVENTHYPFLVGRTGPAARFNYSYAMTTEGTYLYVMNTYSNTIQRISVSSGAITTFVGTPGIAGCTDAIGSEAHFNHPSGIATDGTYLYVADTDNHTIRKITMTSGKVRTLAGTPSLIGLIDGTGTEARFNHRHNSLRMELIFTFLTAGTMSSGKSPLQPESLLQCISPKHRASDSLLPKAMISPGASRYEHFIQI